MRSKDVYKINAFDNSSSITGLDKKLQDNAEVKLIFGIDLGTTNSAISIVKEGISAETIKLKSGKFTMPSCVMWLGDHFEVGEKAYANSEKENVVASVKRLMQSPNATVTFKYEGEELKMTPSEVSAEILKGLIAETDGLYGKIKDVIVTVPAYFNQIGMDNTRKACELAGLNLIALEKEPSAAALQYDIEPGVASSEDIIVYDLGGGTFDVTLARVSNAVASSDFDDIYGFESSDNASSSEGKIIEQLAAGGDCRLGGDDIDEALLQIVCEKLGISVLDLHPVARRFYKWTLESFKKSGVEDRKYTFDVKTTLTDGSRLEQNVIIDEDDFVQSVIPIYKKTKTILDGILKEIPNKAKKILLVGGTTKSPIIRALLKQDYPDMEINAAFDPDLSVTRGAAIKGRILKYGDTNITAFDIIPMTIGILDDGKISTVIPKNTSLPTSKTFSFTTVEDNQTQMSVRIYQGNSRFVEECVELGSLTLNNIRPQKAGEPDLSVTVSISADSLMTCKATIDGIEEIIKLNLAGDVDAQAATLSKEEKQIIRWREFARTLVEPLRSQLNDMLDNYPSVYTREEIIAFIKQHRQIQ